MVLTYSCVNIYSAVVGFLLETVSSVHGQEHDKKMHLRFIHRTVTFDRKSTSPTPLSAGPHSTGISYAVLESGKKERKKKKNRYNALAVYTFRAKSTRKWKGTHKKNNFRFFKFSCVLRVSWILRRKDNDFTQNYTAIVYSFHLKHYWSHMRFLIIHTSIFAMVFKWHRNLLNSDCE